uniref:Protein kinase domain-containing protein n=1 Tax=viral metagenome TaxID=1070528 RepID=A0A6C0D112_9ZZZZ
MKEGKGAYGTVFSSPRLPLLHETLERIQSRDEVSKVFLSYRDYYNEVTRYTSLHNNYDFPYNLFCHSIDHGRISKHEIQYHECVYNDEWSNGDDVYREATHQIIYPRGRDIFSLSNFSEYMVYFEKIIQTVEFFSHHHLVFDDFKNQNLLFLDDRVVVSDYSSIVPLDDFMNPSTFYQSNFKSRYYYIHSPVLNSLLCKALRNEDPSYTYASIEKSYIRYIHQIMFSTIPSNFVYRQSYTVFLNEVEVDIHVELTGDDIKELLLEFFCRSFQPSVQKEPNYYRLYYIVLLFQKHYSNYPSKTEMIEETVERSHIHSIGIMLFEAMYKFNISQANISQAKDKESDICIEALHLAIYCCLQYVEWKGKTVLLFPRLEFIRSYYQQHFSS